MILSVQDLFRYYLLFVYLSQKNIEIDNKEEADFLKSKLCDLLKEFKAKKSDKAEVSINYCNVPLIFIFSLSKLEANEKPPLICCRRTSVEHPSPKNSTA